MPATADVIRVVEAAYLLDGSEEDWLRRLATALQAVARTDLGIVGYHCDFHPEGDLLRSIVRTAEVPDEAVGELRTLSTLLERSHDGTASPDEQEEAAPLQAALRHGAAEPSTMLLMSDRANPGPHRTHDLGTGLQDQLTLVSTHIDGTGCTAFIGGLLEPGSLRPAERAMYQRLHAHIQSGLRLRRRLASAGERPSGVDAPPGGAVLDAEGTVIHASGEAKEAGRREELSIAASRIDAARSQRSGRGPEALKLWEGLVDGSWSLVERLDTDGRRFLLAHRNRQDVRDPRGLSPMETRVVGLAIRGYADKLIGYHLGIATGTASSHLAKAMRKLGLGKRSELLRLLGPLWPAARSASDA